MKTPNAQPHETSSFPGDIPPISSAVPAFVGYTEKAVQDGNDVTHIPVRITSLSEYEKYFGGAPGALRGVIKSAALKLKPVNWNGQFYLYHSLQLYFANGGTACYIVSVGSYSAIPSAADFFSKPAAGATRTEDPKGIDALAREAEPTILVAPDAVLLNADDCSQVQRALLEQCATLGDRFAILDVPNGFQSRTGNSDDVITVFRNSLRDNLSWGAAYYPWLHSSFLAGQKSDLLPPSGALAGIYCQVDENEGVFKSPANVTVAQVSKLAVSLADRDQEDLNMPFDGKAVNAIRNFAGRGILVWGARTLDGNSQDWRYISVRRTVIYVEESLKNLFQPYEGGANTPATWTAVQAVAENFLMGLWRDGGLQGAKPDDAFGVQVGLGITMTQQDLLDGVMMVQVLMALVRPAEFLVVQVKMEMLKP